MVREYFTGVWRDRYVLWSLVQTDLRMKYRKSKLGVAWSVLTPLGLVLIIGFVYSLLFGANPKDFIPLLFAGLNPWLFISGSADGGTMAFIGAEGYLKQTSVNAQIFVIRHVMVNLINLLYSIFAFFIVYIFLRPDLYGVKMLMAIPGLMIMFLFVLGIANYAAIINLNVRDYAPLQSLALQGLFYVTPIIYDKTVLLEKGFAWVYQVNPLYYIIEVVRRPMLGEVIPDLWVYAIAVAITLTVFLTSVLMVMKQKDQIVYKI